MRTLPDKDMLQCVAPPNYMAVISGCKEIRKDHTGKVTAIYLDGETESAMLPDLDMTGSLHFFEMLGKVKEQARKERDAAML